MRMITWSSVYFPDWVVDPTVMPSNGLETYTIPSRRRFVNFSKCPSGFACGGEELTIYSKALQRYATTMNSTKTFSMMIFPFEWLKTTDGRIPWFLVAIWIWLSAPVLRKLLTSSISGKAPMLHQPQKFLNSISENCWMHEL